MKFLLFVFCTILLTVACEDSRPSGESRKIAIFDILTEYVECKSEALKNADCKDFVARAICEYNGIVDFKSNDGFLQYDKVYDQIIANNKWKNLGMATEQDVLNEAQNQANMGFPVVAINIADHHKMPVLIVQGEMAKSNKWKLMVPLCAAFFPASGPEPFINQGLNYAWSDNAQVQLWVRK